MCKLKGLFGLKKLLWIYASFFVCGVFKILLFWVFSVVKYSFYNYQ